MKKKLLSKIAKLAMLTFAAVIVITASDAMTVHAEWDLNGNPTEGTSMAGEGSEGSMTEEELRKEYEELLESASGKYSDVNTLNATVKVSTNILKAKKKAGSYVKQLPKPSKVVVNGKALKINKDYTLTYGVYTENGWQTANGLTSPGLYRIWVQGKGSYNGICTKRIYVYDTAEKVKPMSSVKVTVNKMSYTGEPITENVIKSAKLGKKSLVEGTDYTVTYLNNINSGTGIIRLTAVDGSGLVGEKEVNFTILGNKMNKVKVTGLTTKTYVPNTEITQDVTLTFNGTALTEGTDYTVKYVNNAKVGTAKVVFTGKGLYNGTLTKTFKITKAPLTADMVNEKDIEVKYTGKAVKPKVTLKITTADAKNSSIDLKKGTDYTLAYKNNVKVGNAAQIIIKGKGNYSGNVTVKFSIVNNSAKTAVNKAKSAVKADEETDEEVTDSPEEPVTDEEVTDTTDEPADTEESDNDADTEENPADDETPADDGAENGTGDEEGTAPDETDNSTGSDDAGDTESDDTDNTGSDDAGNTTSDETDSTGSDDADNTATDETGNADSEDADSTVTGETDNEDSENADDTASDETDSAVSDNADSTESDTAVTDADTQSDVETVIPENSVVEDADTNADAA